MELAVGVRLAALEGLAAVGKCSGLSGGGLQSWYTTILGPKNPPLGVYSCLRENR